MIPKIYDVLDQSNDEMYYALGWWPSLNDAMGTLLSGDVNEPPASDYEHEDVYLVEIRERWVGYGDLGKKVASIRWVQDWDNDGEWSWRLEEVKIEPGYEAKADPDFAKYKKECLDKLNAEAE